MTMPFAVSDPRSGMVDAPAPAVAVSAAQYVDFTTCAPDEISARGSRTWWVRGQNFALAFTMAQPGDAFERRGQADEYVALFPIDPAGASVSAGSGCREPVDGASVVVLPPGESRIEITRECQLVRLFSLASFDLLHRCRNDDAYASPDPNVAPFEPWSGAVDGPRLRVYPVADHPSRPGRFGRIFRCSTFMINLFEPDFEPRDPAALSPHHHDDFEQCSLAVDGQWLHHVRAPWASDRGEWREDDHVAVASPSVAIIPPPAVHTSQSLGHVRNQLVDVFCPPRLDFALKPGWVVNEDDYPAPEQVSTS
jgi:hypothetical protein